MSSRCILHLRFDLPPGSDAELPEQVRRLLENITPRVQMIEPHSAVLDLSGALPYFQRDVRGLINSSSCGSSPTTASKAQQARHLPGCSPRWHARSPRPGGAS
ncbi:hypothetical protein [Streptomyces sp. NPDC059371]|uniref:hypothetical protein n=1 Tax=Streptomyces sp. NPDC059371 TaxID=3346812 RepID=UPI0036C4A5F9